MDPLPDFLGYLSAATRLNCSPWDLMDGRPGPPRRWWMGASLVLASAESEAQRRSRKRG